MQGPDFTAWWDKVTQHHFLIEIKCRSGWAKQIIQQQSAAERVICTPSNLESTALGKKKSADGKIEETQDKVIWKLHNQQQTYHSGNLNALPK